MKQTWIVVVAIALLAITPRASDGSQIDVQIPSTYWPDIYFETFDGVTEVLGLEPLRASGLRNHREIRIWIGGGLGYPQEVWRLSETAKGWQGELILYWSLQADGRSGERRKWRRRVKEDSKRWCDAPRSGKAVQTCYGDLPPDVDWSALVSQIETSGLWDLPDASVLPPPRVDVFDGWSLTVELHAGDGYRAYQYPDPDSQQWPEAARAAEIAEVLRHIGPVPRYEIDAYGKRLDSAPEK